MLLRLHVKPQELFYVVAHFGCENGNMCLDSVLRDSVQNLCVSSKVLIFVVEYKSNKNNGAYDATNIGIIFHISLFWRSF